MKQLGTSVALLGALAFACASPPGAEPEKIEPEFQALALPSVPADVQTSAFVDFGGKVHLVGWEVSPAGTAAPGSTVSLKLYWRSVKKAPPCYRLYTHLTGPDGKIVAFDDVGPLRTSSDGVPRFPPSAWTPGTVYVADARAFGRALVSRVRRAGRQDREGGRVQARSIERRLRWERRRARRSLQDGCEARRQVEG
jgi:hypothetical protein